MTDTCLICGQPVPEGRQVCPNCEKYITDTATEIYFSEAEKRRKELDTLEMSFQIYICNKIVCENCGYEFNGFSVEIPSQTEPDNVTKEYIYDYSFCPACESEIKCIHVDEEEKTIYVEVK